MSESPNPTEPEVFVNGRPLLWSDTKKPVPRSALLDGVVLVGDSEDGFLCRPSAPDAK